MMITNLVSSTDEIKIVFVEELRDYLCAERVRDTSIVLSPTGDFLVWVGPEKVAEQTGVWHVGGSHDPADLVHWLQIRAQAWDI